MQVHTGGGAPWCTVHLGAWRCKKGKNAVFDFRYPLLISPDDEIYLLTEIQVGTPACMACSSVAAAIRTGNNMPTHAIQQSSKRAS